MIAAPQQRPAPGAVLDDLRASSDGYVIEAPAAWSQGRTLYGGMTAALCLEADGYSTQAMALFDPAGRQIATARQTVAIFI